MHEILIQKLHQPPLANIASRQVGPAAPFPIVSPSFLVQQYSSNNSSYQTWQPNGGRRYRGGPCQIYGMRNHTANRFRRCYAPRSQNSGP